MRLRTSGNGRCSAHPDRNFQNCVGSRLRITAHRTNAKSPASRGDAGPRKRSGLPAAAAAAATAAGVMLGGLLGPVRRAELLQFANGLLGGHGCLHRIDPCLRGAESMFESNLFRLEFTTGNGWLVNLPDSKMPAQRGFSRTRSRHAESGILGAPKPTSPPPDDRRRACRTFDDYQ